MEAKMNKKIGKWKYVVAVASLLMLMQPLTAQAAKTPLKPGATVTPTAKEVLQVSKVGFTDESFCEISSPTCYGIVNKTTWAFSVKNLSPTRSARNVRIQLILAGVDGNVLLKKIFSAANEIKPGQTTYVASTDTDRNPSSSGVDSSFTGISSGLTKIISKSWIVPTRTIVQNPVTLSSSSTNIKGGVYGFCIISQVCKPYESSTINEMQYVNLSGTFTWLGTPADRGGLVIYIDTSGNPMGGWESPQLPNGEFDFYPNSPVNISRVELLTPYEIGNIANFIYLPTT